MAAAIARYRGLTRLHADGDLRAWLAWCVTHDLDPLVITRVNVELYIRWMQEQLATPPPPSPAGSP